MADWLDSIAPSTPPTAGQNGQSKATGDWLDPSPRRPRQPIRRSLSAPASGRRRRRRVSSVELACGGGWAASTRLSRFRRRLGGNLGTVVSAPTPSLYDTNGAQLTGPGAPPQPLPSQVAINALGLQAPPDQSKASQTAESVLPWLIPNANTVGRISEAPGAVTKLLTAGRSVMGGLTDWAASDAAQEYAQEHGWGPLAQTLAGMAGTQARPSVGHAYRNRQSGDWLAAHGEQGRPSVLRRQPQDRCHSTDRRRLRPEFAQSRRRLKLDPVFRDGNECRHGRAKKGRSPRLTTRAFRRSTRTRRRSPKAAPARSINMPKA